MFDKTLYEARHLIENFFGWVKQFRAIATRYDKTARLARDENPQAMRVRRETVEHPFGTLKMRMGATHFLMKRLPKVATENPISAWLAICLQNLARKAPLVRPRFVSHEQSARMV
jgi:hypothetical protein